MLVICASLSFGLHIKSSSSTVRLSIEGYSFLYEIQLFTNSINKQAVLEQSLFMIIFLQKIFFSNLKPVVT